MEMRRGSNWVNVFETPCTLLYLYAPRYLATLIKLLETSSVGVL